MYPKTAVVVGSKSDKPIALKAKTTLNYFGIPHDDYLASADRTPDRVDYIASQLDNGIYVACIAIAGLSAVLPAAIKSRAPTRVVIGVPVAGDNAPLAGMDALYSIVQRPPGSPVACVGINQAENAALLVAELYAFKFPEIGEALRKYKAEQTSNKGYDSKTFPWD